MKVYRLFLLLISPVYYVWSIYIYPNISTKQNVFIKSILMKSLFNSLAIAGLLVEPLRTEKKKHFYTFSFNLSVFIYRYTYKFNVS